jgi:hypothetical protein
MATFLLRYYRQMSVIGFFIPTMILILVIVGTRNAFTRKSGADAASHSLRHLFQFGILYGLVAISAVGCAGLLARILNRENTLISDQIALARDVSFMVVGLPLLLLVALWTRRLFKRDPEESHSFGWQFYLTAISLSALLNSAFALMSILKWAVGENAYSGKDVANFVVWGSIWVFHLNFDLKNRNRATNLVANFHYLAGSLIGLLIFTSGLVILIKNILNKISGESFNKYSLVGANPLVPGMIPLLVGVAIWYLYWIRISMPTERDRMWNTYVLIFGVGGGFIAADIGAIVTLNHLLIWIFGDRKNQSWTSYFHGFTLFLALAIVGTLIWWYHKTVVREKSLDSRNEIDRVYEYLVAAITLITASVGVMILLVSLLEVLTNSKLIFGSGSNEVWFLAISLLLSAAPIWWLTWSKIERLIAHDCKSELVSPTRKIYLFLIFGVGGITAIVSLVVGIFLLFKDIFGSGFGLVSIRHMRFPISLLLTTGVVAGYHWHIYRQEKIKTQDTHSKVRFVLLVGPSDPEIAQELAAQTGVKIQSWTRIDNEAGFWSFDEVREVIDSSTEKELLIIADKQGLRAIPIVRK